MMYAYITKVFNCTRIVYSDNERGIDGYDGVTTTQLHTFKTQEDRDETLEHMQLSYAEDAESGSSCEMLWIGEIDYISNNRSRYKVEEVKA